MKKSSSLDHLAWLNETDEVLTTSDGKKVCVWELVCNKSDAATWGAWAKHFREHYCLDSMIDALKAGTPYESSRADYLTSLVFPDASKTPGPSIRAGDFAEILIADLLEHHFAYWVPRTRYIDKAIRNESTKGTDVIGIKLLKDDGTASPKDSLFTFEVKAQFSGNKPNPRLQDAVNDSMKDEKRKAETLNAIKQRLAEEGRMDEVLKVQRFQDALKNPYIEQTGAAALFCTSIYDANNISKTTTCSTHPNTKRLTLIVVRADAFMQLVHHLYERAANEA